MTRLHSFFRQASTKPDQAQSRHATDLRGGAFQARRFTPGIHRVERVQHQGRESGVKV